MDDGCAHGHGSGYNGSLQGGKRQKTGGKGNNQGWPADANKYQGGIQMSPRYPQIPIASSQKTNMDLKSAGTSTLEVTNCHAQAREHMRAKAAVSPDTCSPLAPAKEKEKAKTERQKEKEKARTARKEKAKTESGARNLRATTEEQQRWHQQSQQRQRQSVAPLAEHFTYSLDRPTGGAAFQQSSGK